MASLIFWFIVLIFIISSVVKGKKKPVNRNRNAGTTQSRPIPPAQKPRTQPAATQSVKKQQTIYGSYKPPKPKATASTTKYSEAKKAKASEQRAQQPEQMSIFDQNEIVAAAKANTREVEQDNDRDAENQNLMEDVYEVMVKGPKNNIEFQRDFIAEGMDMLNSFNL